MSPFADQSSLLAGAIEYLERAKRRAQAKSSSRAKRSEIKSEYHKLLVLLGRRDGFGCMHCGSRSGDLQIDHIVPIAENGSNDMGNLQLLCPSCNSIKSDRPQVLRLCSS